MIFAAIGITAVITVLVCLVLALRRYTLDKLGEESSRRSARSAAGCGASWTTASNGRYSSR